MALTYLGRVASGGSIDIGSAAADCLVVVGIQQIRSLASGRSITSVTIDGSAATIHAQVGGNATSGAGVGIASHTVTTGGSIAISWTLSGAVSDSSADVWTITGLSSAIPFATGAVNGSDPTATVNYPAGGVAIGVMAGGNGGAAATCTWTGLDTTDSNGGSTGHWSAAHSTGISAETGHSVSVSSSATNEVVVLASWESASVAAAVVADQTIPGFTQAAAGAVVVIGAANETTPDFTQSFTGSVVASDVSANAAQTVDAFANAATLEFVVTCETSQGLEDFSQVAAGTITSDALANQNVLAFTQVFTGFPENPIDIVASHAVPSFANVATGTILIKAASTKTISAFTQVATAHPIQPVSGSANQTFDAFTQSVTLHRGDQTPGLIFKGTIGNVSINRRGLATFEARSSLTLGRGFISERFGPTCRADLFDGRCKVNKDSYKATATVDTVSGQFAFTVTASPDVRAVDGWYDMGQGVIETGDNAGSPFAIKTWTAASLTVETMEPVDMLVSAGDTLTLYPGCDKSSSMCINRYANIINYRGEEFAANRDLQLTTQSA